MTFHENDDQKKILRKKDICIIIAPTAIRSSRLLKLQWLTD